MRLLAILGTIVLVVVLAAAAYAYLGFYNIAASDPHFDYVRWSLETTMDNSVERHADEEVGQIPALDDPEMIRTGAHHYRAEGCIHCHGAPGNPQAEFARHMRPEPPDLTQAVAKWDDAELFWIIQHGIKMTGMPAFGPTHQENELWAMVAFVRRMPEMSQSEFEQLTASPQGAGHHAGGGGHAGEQGGGAAGGADGSGAADGEGQPQEQPAAGQSPNR